MSRSGVDGDVYGRELRTVDWRVAVLRAAAAMRADRRLDLANMSAIDCVERGGRGWVEVLVEQLRSMLPLHRIWEVP